jgi:arginine decarboxylase
MHSKLRNRYIDLIEQTFDWPTLDFKLMNNHLYFHDIPLMEVMEKFGSPIKITYLPKISAKIRMANELFNNEIKKQNYQGTYTFCYCTKSSHFSFILDEVIKAGAHIETSSAYDMDIVDDLYNKGKLTKDHFIVCNGYKRMLYTKKIVKLIKAGMKNLIPVLDNMEELEGYETLLDEPFDVGIRIAADEEPNFQFYTSRLGIRYKDILGFYKRRIAYNSKVNLRMLHFFINTGIRDNIYYWNELAKCVNVYCDLKERCPSLEILNIGGGFPVPHSLNFEYDFEYMVGEIISNIQQICESRDVPVPNIFTEFGSYTVGESGAIIFSVLGQKQQNDTELWYMIDNSFITTIPDAWGLGERFILLAVNNWDQECQPVNLGGLTCDSMDYYNSEAHMNKVFLPRIPTGEKLYIGFFNTGAYQDPLSGYGGVKHCLIPAPQHVIIDKDENGNFTYKLYKDEQPSESMLKLLGYKNGD